MALWWTLACCRGPAGASELRHTAIVKAVKSASGAVVNIRGEKTLAGPTAQTGAADSGRRVNGMGTGVIIDPRGYILTNHHVVDGVRRIQVTLASGTRYTARLLARDPETDLAIIKVDAPEPLPVITIGTSSDLMPGEPVIAVGNAYGYENTVTRGIISALHRAVQVSDAQFYEDLIQTDASINPGNSGGPLLNIDGEMIGVNVAVRAGAQGIGFAVPVDKAVEVAGQLMGAVAARKNWHGVVFKKMPPGTREVVVESVENNSPAEAAGLKPGDVVAAVGDLKIERPLDFYRAVVELAPGKPVELSVRRGQQTVQASLALAEPPARAKPTTTLSWELLGLELKVIPTQEFRQRFQSEYRGGLLVTAVRPQSAAALQGIRRGDVLIGLHDRETATLEHLSWILNRLDFDNLSTVRFHIFRGSELYEGQFPISLLEPQRR
ncbi:MAG: trypsin-like peptidase domain-containing protein [Thermoguttaceae bacterium]